MHKIRISILSVFLLLSLFSCKKEIKQKPIVLMNKAFLFRTTKEEAAVSNKKLFRGEQIIVKKKSLNHYLVYSPRLKISGWIRKNYILKNKYKIGTVISKGILRYADGNVLIPTRFTPTPGTRLLILEELKKFYKVNYIGTKFYFIEKKHVSLKPLKPVKLIHVEGLGKVGINMPFQDLRIIGNELINAPGAMFDNQTGTYFLSSSFKGGETIEILLPSRMKFEIKLINGYAKSLTGYKKFGRLKKLIITEEGEKPKKVFLSDMNLEFQTLGLFDTRYLKIKIKDIHKGNSHKGFAISEISIKRVDLREYEKYTGLINRRKIIYKKLFKANNAINKKEYRKALILLESAMDEIPEELRVSYIGVGIKMAAFKIYANELNDYEAAEKILEGLLTLAIEHGNVKLFDLSKTPVSNKTAIDIAGLSAYFREKKYRKRVNYAFPYFHLKSHVNFYLAKMYFNMNMSTNALNVIYDILINTRKFHGIRGNKSETFYSRMALDLLFKRMPADVAYNFLYNKVLPDYKKGMDSKEDENYLFYILGRLAEKKADKKSAKKFYKMCGTLPDEMNVGEKPFSYALSKKRLREM